jgi:hypothetical protein
MSKNPWDGNALYVHTALLNNDDVRMRASYDRPCHVIPNLCPRVRLPLLALHDTSAVQLTIEDSTHAERHIVCAGRLRRSVMKRESLKRR